MPIILEFTKSVSGTLGFTGSLQGTATSASFVSGAYTAQWALTASNASLASSASFVSGAYTAQWAKITDTASFVSGAYTAQWAKTTDTASFVSGAYTAQWALTASNVTTASYATVAQTVLGSISSASIAAKASVAPIVLNLNNSFGSDLYLTAIPAAITEWDDGQRQQFDFTGYTQTRIIARLVSSSIATASILAQYSADGGTVWNSMSVVLAGPSASLTGSGVTSSAWFPLNSASAADVLIRWSTQNGDAVTGVKFGSIALHAR